jgi:hypothetical protein
MVRFLTLDRLFLATVLGGHGLLAVWALVADDPVAKLTQELLPFVQVTLLTLWVLLGPGHWGIRLLGVPLVSGCLWAWASFHNYWSGQEVLPLGTWVIALAVVAGLTVRLTGLRVIQPDVDALQKERPVQFSLRFMLVITTVCCLLVMGGKWVYAAVDQYEHTDFGYSELSPILARGTLATGLMLVSLAAAVVVLGARRPWLFSLALIPLAVGVGTGVALLLHQSDARLSLGFWMTAQGVLIAATLAPLCNLGYRLMRARSRFAAARPVRAATFKISRVNHEPVSAAP